MPTPVTAAALMTTAAPNSPSQPIGVESTFRTLLGTFGMLRRVMEPFFARFGISGAQWGVLISLKRAEDEGTTSVRLTDLSERLTIRPPSVTGVVDRLLRMGLVGRIASPDDQRVKQVSLTVTGRRLVRKIQRGHAAQVRNVLAGLSLDEQRDLQSLLIRLKSHLETITISTNGSVGAKATNVARARADTL